MLVPEMMSSEEEAENENGQIFFMLHKPNFSSEKIRKYYENNMHIWVKIYGQKFKKIT